MKLLLMILFFLINEKKKYLPYKMALLGGFIFYLIIDIAKINCVCQIGECQSDFDPIMTSNIGINLRAPKKYEYNIMSFFLCRIINIMH